MIRIVWHCAARLTDHAAVAASILLAIVAVQQPWAPASAAPIVYDTPTSKGATVDAPAHARSLLITSQTTKNPMIE